MIDENVNNLSIFKTSWQMIQWSNLTISVFVSDFILVVGGRTSGNSDVFDTVEVVSANPNSNPVPTCMQNINNFPNTIYGAVGTTFGKLQAKLILHTEEALSVVIIGLVRFTPWHKPPQNKVWCALFHFQGGMPFVCGGEQDGSRSDQCSKYDRTDWVEAGKWA